MEIVLSMGESCIFHIHVAVNGDYRTPITLHSIVGNYKNRIIKLGSFPGFYEIFTSESGERINFHRTVRRCVSDHCGRQSLVEEFPDFDSKIQEFESKMINILISHIVITELITLNCILKTPLNRFVSICLYSSRRNYFQVTIETIEKFKNEYGNTICRKYYIYHYDVDELIRSGKFPEFHIIRYISSVPHLDFRRMCEISVYDFLHNFPKFQMKAAKFPNFDSKIQEFESKMISLFCSHRIISDLFNDGYPHFSLSNSSRWMFGMRTSDGQISR